MFFLSQHIVPRAMTGTVINRREGTSEQIRECAIKNRKALRAILEPGPPYILLIETMEKLVY
jgi:hypothetical protein